jgi:uncharacterized protein with ParB-like and HNH nuclease domain
MKTTATNRKIRELLTLLREGKLQPRPEFQRRLVWNNKDKSSFLETVLLNYPFPEIYIAAGEVDVDTGEGKEMLVDGQQRITTLYQYFTGSPDLRLSTSVPPYAQLSKEQKEQFLQYDVVVRDLGKVELEQIREVFRRINATSYALNAMEIHNARYEGDYKKFAETVAQKSFFEKHGIFSASEIRRMQDTRFALGLVTTIVSTYFNRDDDIEDYLKQYNDEFPLEGDVERDLNFVFNFIEDMRLPDTSRAWKKADLFTLIVELHRALIRDKLRLEASRVAKELSTFYSKVDAFSEGFFAEETEEAIANYHKAALQATNDRSSRITRGQIIHKILRSVVAV